MKYYDKIYQDTLRKSEITAFNANAYLIAIGTRDGSVTLFDIDGNHNSNMPSWKHKAACLCIIMDEKGEIFGSCSEDGEVKINSLFGDEEVEQKMKFRSPVSAISFSPDYKDSGKIVVGTEKVTLCEKGLLGSKKTTTIAVGVQGKISKIDWSFSDTIIWADYKDIKIFDMNKRETISIIPRQNSELNPQHFKCNFFWNQKQELIIAWGDYIQICKMIMT